MGFFPRRPLLARTVILCVAAVLTWILPVTAAISQEGSIARFEIVSAPPDLVVGRKATLVLRPYTASAQAVPLLNLPDSLRFHTEKTPGPVLLTQRGTDGSFIVVMNVTDQPVDLTGWHLRYEARSPSRSSLILDTEVEMPIGAQALPGAPMLATRSSQYISAYPIARMPALSMVWGQEYAPLTLIDPRGKIVDVLAAYGGFTHRKSPGPGLQESDWNWAPYASRTTETDIQDRNTRYGSVDHDNIIDWVPYYTPTSDTRYPGLSPRFRPALIGVRGEILRSVISNGDWLVDVRFTQPQDSIVMTAQIGSQVLPVGPVIRVGRPSGFTLQIPGSIKEGQTIEGKIVCASVTPNARTFVISSLGSSNRLSTVPSVTVPPGSLEAQVSISAAENELLEGTLQVSVEVTDSEGSTALSPLEILDNEPLSFRVTVPEEISSGSSPGGFSGQIRLSRHAERDLTFQLDSSSPAILYPPRSALVRAGTDRVNFSLIPRSYPQSLTNRGIEITASETSFGSRSGLVNVLNPGLATFAVIPLRPTFLESSGIVSNALTLKADAVLDVGFDVRLISEDTDWVQIPPVVHFEGGRDRVVIPLTFLDDAIAQGPREARFQYQIEGRFSERFVIQIADDEPSAPLGLSVVAPPPLPPPTAGPGTLFTNAPWGTLDGKRLRVYSHLTASGVGLSVLELNTGLVRNAPGINVNINGTTLSEDGDILYLAQLPSRIIQYDLEREQIRSTLFITSAQSVDLIVPLPGRTNMFAVTINGSVPGGGVLVVASNNLVIARHTLPGSVYPVASLGFSSDANTAYIIGGDPAHLQIESIRWLEKVSPFRSIQLPAAFAPYRFPFLTQGNRLFSPTGWTQPLTNLAQGGSLGFVGLPSALGPTRALFASQRGVSDVYYLCSFDEVLRLLVFDTASVRLRRTAILPRQGLERPMVMSVSPQGGVLLGFPQAFGIGGSFNPSLWWLPQDPTIQTNAGDAQLQVLPFAKSVDGPGEPITVDREIRVGLALTNLGPAALASVRVRAQIPPGLDFKSAVFQSEEGTSAGWYSTNGLFERRWLLEETADVFVMNLRPTQSMNTEILFQVEKEDLAGMTTKQDLPLRFEVGPQGVSDLALITPDLLSAGPFNPGQRVQGSFLLTNQGSSRSRAFVLQLRSAQQSITNVSWNIEGEGIDVSSANPSGLYVPMPVLNPGEVRTIHCEFAPVLPGLYSAIEAEIQGVPGDSLWLVNPSETNLSNNRAFLPIQVRSAQPSPGPQTFSFDADAPSVMSPGGKNILLQAGVPMGVLHRSLLEISMESGAFRVVVPPSAQASSFVLDADGDTVHIYSSEQRKLTGYSLRTGGVLYQTNEAVDVDGLTVLVSHPTRPGLVILLTSADSNRAIITAVDRGTLQARLELDDLAFPFSPLTPLGFIPATDNLYVSEYGHLRLFEIRPSGIVLKRSLETGSGKVVGVPLADGNLLTQDGLVLDGASLQILRRLDVQGIPVIDGTKGQICLFDHFVGTVNFQIVSESRLHVLDAASLDWVGSHRFPLHPYALFRPGLVADGSIVGLNGGGGLPFLTVLDPALLNVPLQAELGAIWRSGGQEIEINQSVTNSWMVTNAGPRVLSNVEWSLSSDQRLEIQRVNWVSKTGPQVSALSQGTLGSLNPWESIQMTTVSRARSSGLYPLRLSVGSTLPDPGVLPNEASVSIEVPEPPAVLLESGAATESGNAIPLPIRLSRASTLPVSFTLTARGGTALAGLDFLVETQKVVFQPGEVFQLAYMRTVRDTISEEDESFYLRLTGVTNAIVPHEEVEWTIHDRLPFFSVTSSVGCEHPVLPSPIQFQFGLSQPSSKPVSFEVQTFPGAAQPGQDFLSEHRVLTIPPGKTNVSLSVSVVNDGEEELDERMQLDLISITGAASVSALAEGTIQDDDGRFAMVISDVVVKGGRVEFNFTSNPGSEYVVEQTPSLHPPQWKPRVISFKAVDRVTHFVEPPRPFTFREPYYRVVRISLP